jgi:hypothetical protein
VFLLPGVDILKKPHLEKNRAQRLRFDLIKSNARISFTPLSINNGIVLPSPNLTSGQPQVGIGTITTGYSKKLEPHNGRKLVKSWLGASSTDRTLNMGLRCKFEAREKDCQPTET